MKKFLILAVGGMLLLVFVITAFTSEKGEVYTGFLILTGVLLALIAIFAASKQQHVVAPPSPSTAKKYRSRNLFDDEVDPEMEANSYDNQNAVAWSFFFLLIIAAALWVLGMMMSAKIVGFITFILFLVFVSRYFSPKQLEEAWVKLEQESGENHSRLSA